MIDQLLTTTALQALEQGPEQAFFSFLLGGAISLLGGLLSKPKAPPPPPVAPPAPPPQVVQVVQTTNKVDIADGVQAAKDAGFNPTTAARLGLISGFNTLQTPFLTQNPKFVDWQTSYNRELQIQQDQYNYQQQKRSWLGSMFSSAGNLISGFGQAKSQTQRNSLQNQLLRSEINRNNSQSYRNYGYLKPNQNAAPSTEWYNPTKSTQPIASKTNPNYDGAPYLYDWETGDVTVTNPYASLHVNPNVSDVENKETRYGDSSFLSPTWFHAWGTQISDISHNIGVYNEHAIANQKSNVAKTNQKLNSWLGKPSDWLVN